MRMLNDKQIILIVQSVGTMQLANIAMFFVTDRESMMAPYRLQPTIIKKSPSDFMVHITLFVIT